jgi:tRNA (cytidine/uridine-2'-O-)-methyltransferase
MPKHNIVLVSPEIPGNTGSIGRTALALNFRLILIHPLGFDLDEKKVRRAGLDYWKDVDLVEYNSWEEFLSSEGPNTDNLFFFSKTGKKVYYHQEFPQNSYLIFGSETKGLPPSFFEKYEEKMLSLPIFNKAVRSLNLSNVATAVCFEVLRQTE